jgi:hypothetical protein
MQESHQKTHTNTCAQSIMYQSKHAERGTHGLPTVILASEAVSVLSHHSGELVESPFHWLAVQRLALDL